MNHHVHRVQNMYDIRGCRVSKPELLSAEVDPYFKKKIKITSVSVGKISQPKFSEQNPPERN